MAVADRFTALTLGSGMRRFQISADGFSTLEVSCEGCSGDALTRALTQSGTPVQQWKVNRRNPDNRSWFFDVTINGKTKEFRVDTLT